MYVSVGACECGSECGSVEAGGWGIRGLEGWKRVGVSEVGGCGNGWVWKRVLDVNVGCVHADHAGQAGHGSGVCGRCRQCAAHCVLSEWSVHCVQPVQPVHGCAPWGMQRERREVVGWETNLRSAPELLVKKGPHP